MPKVILQHGHDWDIPSTILMEGTLHFFQSWEDLEGHVFMAVLCSMVGDGIGMS